MQLKIGRSQRMGGVMGKTVVFILDVRAEYTREEATNINRYKLANEIIYRSEDAKRHLERMNAHADSMEGGGVGGMFGGLAKGMASLAMAKMSLNISIGSLGQGHRIECKNLNELAEAEETVMQACRNIRDYLKLAASFNGTTFVVDFGTEEERVHRAGGGEVYAPIPASIPAQIPKAKDAVYENVPAIIQPSPESVAASYGEFAYEDFGQKTAKPNKPVEEWEMDLHHATRRIMEGGVRVVGESKTPWEAIKPHVDAAKKWFWDSEPWQKLAVIGGAALLLIGIAYYSFRETPTPTAEDIPVTNDSRPLNQVNLGQ